LSSANSPVFSVIQYNYSKNPSNMPIWCKQDFYILTFIIYHHSLKWLCCTIFLWKRWYIFTTRFFDCSFE